MVRKHAVLTMVAIGLAGAARAGAPDGPPTAELLTKAGLYTQRYVRDFPRVAAEEDYLQKFFASRNARLQQMRSVRSDTVFVDVGGNFRWMLFRDVFEVDGKPVRSREDRLEKLFSKPSSQVPPERLQQAVNESAQYNLGAVSRNFNLPTLALVFLHPDNQVRFNFKRKGKEEKAGVVGWVIEYEEKTSPAFIRDGANNDLFCKGKVVVADDDGRLLYSELKVKDADGSYQVEIDVEFAPWGEGGIWVPQEMRETCSFVPPAADRMPALRSFSSVQSYANSTIQAGEFIEAVARYSNFRTFGGGKRGPVEEGPESK